MILPENYSKGLTAQQLSFLQSFFAKCPDSFSSSIILKTFPKNHILISTDDTSAHVYILLEGRLQAIEERVADDPYYFTELFAIDIVGDFELFTTSSARVITLTTLVESLCLVIPATDYLTWIRNDANALFIRTQMLIRQLIEQTHLERQNFFLDNKTRFLQFLYGECNREPHISFPVLIKYTRQDISSKLGCSVRTINRIIQGFYEEGYLELKHGKVHISKEQYTLIQASLDSSLNKNN